MKANGVATKEVVEVVPPLGRPIESRYVADDVVDRLVTAVGLGVYVGGQQLPTEQAEKWGEGRPCRPCLSAACM